MAKELPKTYDPKQVEKRIYKEWCDKGYFHAEVDKTKKPFTIVKDKDVYVIKGDAVEKLFRMTNFNTEEAYERFSNKLRRMGIDEELEKMGIHNHRLPSFTND